MRYLALALVLVGCSSSGTSSVDAGPVDAGMVDAGRPDPLRLPDGGCPACERDGVCQPGDAVDACGSSGACTDCEAATGGCIRWTCGAPNAAPGACFNTNTFKAASSCSLGFCTDDPQPKPGDVRFCRPCGHRGEECCPSFDGLTPCADGGGLTCSSGTCQ